MTGDIDFTVPALVSKNMQASFVVSSEPNIPNPALITYSWSVPDFSPVTQEGKTFTATASEIAGTYPVTLTARSERYCDLAITKDVVIQECAPPGTTGVTFAEFNPCAGAPYGSTYTLTDDRDQKTYKVKYMPDGRYWMVQDLMFGTCTASSWKNDNSEAATKVDPTVASGYVGHCRTHTVSGVGYLYNWSAVMNNSLAYMASSDNSFSCSGTGSHTSACQGVCPSGWHVPTYYGTATEWGELITAVTSYCTSNKCNPVNYAEIVRAPWCSEDGTISSWYNVQYWSSTYKSPGLAYAVYVNASSLVADDHEFNRGILLRCVMNY
jgi:uncharacterized protein (TIGR02145 family)